MLPTMFYQPSLVRVDPDAIDLATDAFERCLPEALSRLLTVADFVDFHPIANGAPSRCPIQLTTMLLLQARYALSDREVVSRCVRDLGFRYALGVAGHERPPQVSSLRRFRAWVRKNKGSDWLFRLSLELPKADGLVDDAALQAIDSTNTECRGAVIDTFNLIAVAIGRVVRFVARCIGTGAEVLARKWGLERYLSRSVKGTAAIDWSSETERNALLTREIRDADRLPPLVRGLGVRLPDEVDAALALVAKVARQDVEQLADGTFRIAHGTASGRTISVTDPEASHGRKSASKTITGFKTNLAGTIVSQFVTGITITPAATPDANATEALLAATDAVNLKPTEALADAAYGSAANRRLAREAGVTLRARLPTPGHKGYTKRDFKLSPDHSAITCPLGHSTTTFGMVKDPAGSDDKVRQFRFPADLCRACPMKEHCSARTTAGRGRIVTLNRYEEEIQQAQDYNASPQGADTLRKRSAVERLISHLVRMGMRHARFFGMHMVEYQALLTAAAYNLQRYMTLTAR